MQGKEDTFVLDFVNTQEDIHRAFKPYYETTTLGDIPTVDKLNELSATLDNWNIFYKADIQEFAEVWFSHRLIPTGKEHKQLNSIVDKAIEKYKNIDPDDAIHNREQQKLFKSQLQSYLNLYMFISQIVPYGDSGHEKRYVYIKALLAKLPKGTQESDIDLSKVVALQYYRLTQIGEGSISLSEGEAEKLKGSTDVGTGRPDATDYLSKLLEELNEAFGTEFTLDDQLFFDSVEKKAMLNENIVTAVKNNTLESFTDYFDKQMIDLFFELIDNYQDSCTKVLNNSEVKEKVAKRLAKQIYETVRRKGD